MYQVWTKEEFEGWKRTDCPDMENVQAAVMSAIKAGKDPFITVEVPFEVSIKVKGIYEQEKKPHKEASPKLERHDKKEDKVEANKSEAPVGEDTGAKSKGKV